MTLNPFLRKYSQDVEPLIPVEKFSIDLTVFFSKGTEVPPEDISIIFSDEYYFRKGITFFYNEVKSASYYYSLYIVI